MFSAIINFFVMIYSFPVRTWQGGCGDGSQPVIDWTGWKGCEYGFYQEPDKFTAFLAGFFLYGITALVITILVKLAWSGISRGRNRQHCQHCDKWTLKISNGDFAGCINDRACCEDCIERHLDEEVEAIATNEPLYTCGHCGHVMGKVIEHRIIIDICGTCGAIMLSSTELKHIKELATQRGYNRGYHAGEDNGHLMGFIIGSSIN